MYRLNNWPVADGLLATQEIQGGYVHDVLFLEDSHARRERGSVQHRKLCCTELVDEGLTIVVSLGGLDDDGMVVPSRPLGRRDLELLGVNVDPQEFEEEPSWRRAYRDSDLVAFWLQG